MNKTTLIAVIGIIIVIVIVVISFALKHDDMAESPVQTTSSLKSIDAVLPTPKTTTKQPTTITPEKVSEPNVIAPSFDIVSITKQGESVIAGRAEPGSVVTIMNENTEIGQATANKQGEWVYIPDEPLSPGTKRLGLEIKNKGNEPVLSKDVIVIVVPEPNKDIAGNETSTPSGALALKVSRTNEGLDGAIILQNPTKKSSSDLSVDIIDYNKQGNLSVSGQAKPNANVNLYLDNLFIGQAKTDENNNWQIIPDAPIEPGVYNLRADEVDEKGIVSSRVAIPFSQADTDSELPEGQFIVVQPGNSLWRLARRTYGSGFSYSVIYRANKDMIKDPDLIYAGQIFALPKQN